ncbi:MAG: dihydroxyacetone kinase [Candidatus Cloacimonas sp. SDB]|nr:MAG: dihydroxyacetone kinase [Candidatus Cloacimonas sp. SDB]
MRKTVLVPIADGTEEFEAVGIIDTLRRAGAEVTVASVNKLTVTASREVVIRADKLLADCVLQEYDLIALPGGLPGAEHLRDDKTLTQMLLKQAESGKFYAAICASPVVVLQHHGLLKNKFSTAHPAIAAKLKKSDKAGQRTVVDGNCITSQGPGTVLEFSIKLVELLFDKNRAKKNVDSMLIKID